MGGILCSHVLVESLEYLVHRWAASLDLSTHFTDSQPKPPRPTTHKNRTRRIIRMRFYEYLIGNAGIGEGF